MYNCILIVEKQKFANGNFEIELSFNDNQVYTLVVNNPFSPKQEQQLEQYFEEYLRFPFTDEVTYQQIAAGIIEYGESLFQQIFQTNPEIFQTYQQISQSGQLKVEIIGKSLEFNAIHWESLKNPQNRQPFVITHPVIRKPFLNSNFFESLVISKTLNVLLVVARHKGQVDASYRTISLPLVKMIWDENENKKKIAVNIDIVRPATYCALVQQLEAKGKGFYHLIHFDTHGSLLEYDELDEGIYRTEDCGREEITSYEGQKAFLLLMSDKYQNYADAIEAGELANLLHKYQIPIVVLNACQSAKQSATEMSIAHHLAKAGGQVVIAMAYSVTVSAAKQFMQTLYVNLLQTGQFTQAILKARHALYQNKARSAYFNVNIELEDWLLPIVYQQTDLVLPLHPAPPIPTKSYSNPITQYGFFGRDLDILEIENRLLLKDSPNIVLIQGLGGIGKSTLLRHLGWWWQTTNLVAQVFYFGYDEKTWTLQWILHELAQQLFDEAYFQHFLSLSESEQQDKVVNVLRETRHLLILDNLESITAQHETDIQHTLSTEEQQAFQRFLQALLGGNTLVLLGSRSNESWLAEGTFEQNIHELAGLDAEATADLTDKILATQHVSHYRQDTNLQRLLGLLNGHPLALQVILSNLGKKTPSEVLQALESGDISIDKTGDKTESLLKCIEYSYNNLSEDAQKLLLCLAPFEGVFGLYELTNQDGNSINYAKRLQQQAILGHLPFKIWENMLKETEHWGLLKPHPDIEFYRQLHPILPHFLRGHLQILPKYQQTIETTFQMHYSEISKVLGGLLTSELSKERQFAKTLMHLEYRNIGNALELALIEKKSIHYFYVALSIYLDTQRAYQQSLELETKIISIWQNESIDSSHETMGFDLVVVLDNLAHHCSDLKDYKKAEQHYEKILSMINQLVEIDKKQIKEIESHTYHQLGCVAQEQQKYPKAENFYQKALKIYIETNNYSEQAKTYHQLGYLAYDLDELPKAKKYYQKALQYKNEPYEQASTYHQLGMVAQAERNWPEAIMYYQKALLIFLEFKEPHLEARVYNNLGIIAGEQSNWQEAEKWYKKALGIFVKLNDYNSQSIIYNWLGVTAIEQKKSEQAKNYYLTALNLSSQNSYHITECILPNLYRLYQTTQDSTLVSKAAEILNEKEEIVRSWFEKDLTSNKVE